MIKIIERHWYLQYWIYHKEKIDDCKNINSLNPLYLNITHADGYIKEKGVNKYLVIASTYENKELLKSIMIFLMELEIKLKK